MTAALLVAAGGGVSGYVYNVGLGCASDGYYDDAYGCDPYCGYDAYYNCNYGQAFSNIGFGGGLYDNYYHPGHGILLFNTFGRRYPMREQYRRYWTERRHNWYREHRGRDLGSNRYEGRDGWRASRRIGNDQWRGGDGRGAGAVPLPKLVRRKAGVEGGVMVAPMSNPTGETSGRQMGIPSPRLRGKFYRYGRMLHLLNNRLNPVQSSKANKRNVSACLKAA